MNVCKVQSLVHILFMKFSIGWLQVAFENGTTTSYALFSAQERGQLFISPGAEVYKGMIVGIHQRPGDLSLNVCKKKAATNVRSNKEVTGEKPPRNIVGK